MTPQRTKNQYHFPGNNFLPNITVEAESREEASKIYMQKINKKGASQEVPITPAPEKKLTDEENKKEE